MRYRSLLSLAGGFLTLPACFALPNGGWPHKECSAAYDQCGGVDWHGGTCCPKDFACAKSSEWYSQCRPADSKGCTFQAYDQCGGIGFAGEGCCMSGTSCVKLSKWWSQCDPVSASDSTSTLKHTSSTTSTTKHSASILKHSTSDTCTPTPTTSSCSCSCSCSSSSSTTTSPPTSNTSSTTTTTSSSTTTTSSATPLPTVTSKPSELRLSPTWNISDVPRIREHYWTISEAIGAPDGFERTMLVVNDQFPGPLVEANEGDTIVVHVQNLLPQPGLAQNGSNWQDGPSGVTQCPIGVLETYTYNFTVFRPHPDGQFGSYWWHAHRRALYADGITGPLIIHSKNDPLKRGEDYDIDQASYLSLGSLSLLAYSRLSAQIITIHDWYHTDSTTITDALETTAGFNGSFVAPSPQTGLINGRGQWNCSFAAPNDTCSEIAPLELTFPPDQLVRLRFIHMGAHPVFFVSVDEHVLTVIEADDTPVVGQPVHRVPINVAQRYSAVFNTSGASVGDSFYLRLDVNTGCLGNPFADLTIQNLAIIRIAYDEPATGGTPNSTDWTDATTGACVDLDESLLVPRIAIDAPATSNQFSVFNSSFALPNGIFAWTLNSVTFENFAPLLQQVIRGETISPNISATIVAEREEVLDIAIQNLQGADHPFHLHGMKMSLIGRGTGVLDADLAANISYNLTNPIRRDTFSVSPGAWIVVRVIADIPGVHAFHCHIVWHQSQGLMGVVVVQPEVVRGFQLPAANTQLCAGGNSSLIDPGRKRKRAPEPEHWHRRALAASPVETGAAKNKKSRFTFGF